MCRPAPAAASSTWCTLLADMVSGQRQTITWPAGSWPAVRSI